MKRFVRDVMNAPHVVSPETSIAQASRLTATRDFCHLPVVDAGELVGMLCVCDLPDASPEGRAEDYMSAPVETIDPEATLGEAAVRMREASVGSLAVVVDEELIGIVTRDDLVREGIAVLGGGHRPCAACGGRHHVWDFAGSELCRECRQAESEDAEDGVAD